MDGPKNEHDCKHEKDFITIYKRLEHKKQQLQQDKKEITTLQGDIKEIKEKQGNQLTEILVTQQKIVDIYQQKEKDDTTRDQRIENVEKDNTQIKTNLKIINEIYTWIKAIGIALIIFIATFMVKTFIWGF